MNYIKLKLNYTSNFSPNLNKKNPQNNKKIFIKNILLFFYILRYKKINVKSSIFIKPIEKKNFLILRAPYRYKLGRLNIGILRYSTDIHIKIKLNSSKKNLNLNFLKKLPNILESNMLHFNKFTIFIPVILLNNLKIKNF